MALQIGTSESRKVVREILENEKPPELKDLAAQQFIFINVTWTKFIVKIGNPVCSLSYHSFSSYMAHYGSEWSLFGPTNWKTHTVCTLAARDTCKLGPTISWPSKWPWANMWEKEQVLRVQPQNGQFSLDRTKEQTTKLALSQLSCTQRS